MSQKIIIVLDCGATNVRSVAINEKGKILAQKSFSNNTQVDSNFEGGLIWDVEEIWNKLIKATQEVLTQIDTKEIAGITVTTFGVDGAPMTKDGKLLYPVISWACQRTVPVMDQIGKYIPFEKLYGINGIHKFSFNTINKLIWLKENKPEILEQSDYYTFISSIFIQKLCREFVTDTTMAGTSMLTDISKRNFSNEIFEAMGVKNKFPELVEPGTLVGEVTQKAAEESGLPSGLPVIAAGHDTQFAIFGSGAKENQAVLSSGTWEIIMARTNFVSTGADAIKNGITNEFDAIPGLYNPGMQWLGSGILEWIKNMFYEKEAEELSSDKLYELMINEASLVQSSSLFFNPDFLNENGNISGLGIKTKREEIYRAALEALANKTNENLHVLEKAGNFKADSLIVVGGGSKNRLWNQLRANACEIPIHLIDQKETTVLGAALFAFAGVGVYNSPEEARSVIDCNTSIINPKK